MDEQKHEAEPEEQPKADQPEPGPAPTATSTSSSEPETSTGLDPNLAALLAYLFGWISGLIFFLIENKNKYVRFHALQSILLNVAYIVAFVILSLVFGIFANVPGIGVMMLFIGPLAYAVVGIGFLVLWIMALVKAYQGEKWLMPIIGDVAEKNS